MKSMFAKQQRGQDGGDLDSDEESSWKNGINQTEQMYLLASASIGSSKEDIEFSKDDLKCYKKQVKNYFMNKS